MLEPNWRDHVRAFEAGLPQSEESDEEVEEGDGSRRRNRTYRRSQQVPTDPVNPLTR